MFSASEVATFDTSKRKNMAALTPSQLLQIKGAITFILIIVLVIQSQIVTAQLLKNMQFKGIDVSFGTRSFELQSDITEISSLEVMQDGGQLGVIFGNDVIRTKIGLAGFYYSSNSVCYQVDLFQSDIAFNVYPLMMISGAYTKVQPYLTGGAAYDKTKFFGHYLNPDKTTINYSTSKVPFLGSVNQLRGSFGAGIEYHLLDNGRDFIHFFTEIKYGKALAGKTSFAAFENTSISDQLLVNVGVRFGAHQ